MATAFLVKNGGKWRMHGILYCSVERDEGTGRERGEEDFE